MTEDSEGILLEREGVRITPRTATFDRTTHPVSSLGSVSVHHVTPGFGPFAVAACGFTLGGIAIVSHALRDVPGPDWGLVFVGSLLLVVGVLAGIALWRSKGAFVVRVQVAGALVEVFGSVEERDARRVAEALTAAISRRD